jgi:ribose transport system substrate-binding protein
MRLIRQRMARKVILVGLLLAAGAAFTTQAFSSGGQYGVGLKLTNQVVAKGQVLRVVSPWLVWNKSTCRYQTATKHPATYVAATRKIVGSWTIGYMHYGNSDPFGIANSASVAKTSKLAGFNLHAYNLEYPSKTVPLQDAKLAVTQGDQGVIQGNLDPTILPAFFKILQDKSGGCVPTIAVYGGPGDKTPAIGAIFKDTGTLQGQWLAKEAKARNFTPAKTAFVQCADPSLATFVALMFPASIAGLRSAGFAIPKANIYQLNCQGQSSSTARQQVTDWFTAHPNFSYVLVNGPDDQRITGVVQALKAIGRHTRTTLTVGAGADPVGQSQVRNGDEDATIAFFPEHYGLFLLPVLEDVMAGNPVPQFVEHVQIVITKKNLAKYYPKK